MNVWVNELIKLPQCSEEKDKELKTDKKKKFKRKETGDPN